MRKYRSPACRAVGLAQGQVVKVAVDELGISVSGVNPLAESVVLEGVCYHPSGNLMVHPDSLLSRSGAQVRIRRPA